MRVTQITPKAERVVLDVVIACRCRCVVTDVGPDHGAWLG
jgi:hypothetical protein